MSIKEVGEVVRRFLSQPQNEVLAIKGDWGVGKTHAWHELITKHKSEIQPRIYAYVSLFGITSLADLRLSILSCSRPVEDIGVKRTFSSLNENWWQLAVGRVAALKANVGRLESQGLKNVFITLDALAPSLLTDRLICLDDFERIDAEKLSHDAVLGFISTLKETANCKIVIILNDAQVASEKETFQMYREKVIDKEIQFDPSVEEAIGWGLAENSPFAVQVKAFAASLKIKNVRILRKIGSVVANIAPVLNGKHSDAVKHALSSAVLLTWCYFEKTGLAPSIDFVLKVNLLSTFADRTKDDKVEPEPAEQRWRALLSAYNFLYCDELDAALVKVIERGYLEGSGFREEISTKETLLQKGDVQQKFADAWRLFHDSLADNEADLTTAMVSSVEAAARYLNPSDLNAVVCLLRQLNKDSTAKHLINVYLTARGHEPQVFDLRANPFGNQITDDGIRVAFAEKLRTVHSTVSLREAAEKVATGSWSQEESAALSAATSEEIYAVLKGPLSVPLHKVVDAFLTFYGSAVPHVAQRAQEALRRLGGESRLNAVRVRRWGVVEAHADSQYQSQLLEDGDSTD